MRRLNEKRLSARCSILSFFNSVFSPLASVHPPLSLLISPHSLLPLISLLSLFLSFSFLLPLLTSVLFPLFLSSHFSLLTPASLFSLRTHFTSLMSSVFSHSCIRPQISHLHLSSSISFTFASISNPALSPRFSHHS